MLSDLKRHPLKEECHVRARGPELTGDENFVFPFSFTRLFVCDNIYSGMLIYLSSDMTTILLIFR